MATLTTQTITAGGISPSYAPATTGGDKLRPGKGVFLHVLNGAAADVTVTLATPGTVSGLAIDDRQVTVAAGADQMVPVPDGLYGDPADGGLAAVTYSDATSVTVAALRI